LTVNAGLIRKFGVALAVILLIFMLGRFFSESYARAITNSNSAISDQSEFLQLGLELREIGRLTDGTRNPLYPALLATFAHRDWSYFTVAKLLSIVFGLLTIVAVFVLGWRRFNPFTGITAAYLVSINVEFTAHSARALTESLLVFLVVLAWFAMLYALDDKARWGYWALAGVLVALAYLAKGSGQLLAFAFVISGVLIYRGRLFTSKSFWIFVAAYLITVSPLWIYNTRTYGSPTFNYAITHQMWMDSWSEWHPDDTDNLPTGLSYLQTHSLGEIFEREWTGLLAERNILIKTLYPTRTLMVDQFLLSPLSWYALALLILLPLIFWRRSYQFVLQHRSAVVLTTLVIAIFFVLFAWYTPIIPGTRFLLSIMPLIFLMGAYILSLILGDIAQRGRWGQILVVTAVLVVILMQMRWWLGTVQEPVQVLLTSSLFDHDREFGQDAAAPLKWLAEGYPGARVAWGPSGHSLPVWAFTDRLNLVRYPPNVTDIPDLTADFTSRGVEFVIVDIDMVARHKTLLEERFPSNGYAIEITETPPNWAFAYAYRAIPCEWCIFRLPQSTPAQVEARYELGDSLQLTGYDLSRTEGKPGDTVHLTLHWQSLAPTDEDFTVFAQLLGPDGQLHGQQDNQPVGGLWPTTRWSAGDRVADRYDIAISPTAPPGQYHLLVGMYNATTGERLSVTQNGAPVPDNAILLTTLNVLPPED
jgi:4-amino-4-deoxy-L-arabinose transferase-like glycosyltransferase